MRPVALHNTDVVRLERVFLLLAAHHSHSAVADDGLVHGDTGVWVVEAADVLQVFHLAFEQGQVVGEHLPVQFFSHVLLTPVLLVLLLSGVVDIAVEGNELMPLLQVLADVVDVLLADLQEVLPTGEVVQHDGAADLVEQLLLEVLAFIEKLLHLLSSLGQHEVFGLLVVVSHLVELLDQCRILHFPLLVILLLEQFVLLLLKQLL